MPLPVCHRVRAIRSCKVRGWCAAKREKFFGWSLHLIINPAGVPVSFSILPAGLHDLTPTHELTWLLPPWCQLSDDKGYNAEADEASIWEAICVRFVPIRQANMKPNSLEERASLTDTSQSGREC